MAAILLIGLYVIAVAIAISFPLSLVFVGVMIGIRGERRRVLAYLRSLDEPVSTLHLATRIEARAHCGLDVSMLSEVLEEPK
jgi:hypothetical protein